MSDEVAAINANMEQALADALTEIDRLRSALSAMLELCGKDGGASYRQASATVNRARAVLEAGAGSHD